MGFSFKDDDRRDTTAQRKPPTNAEKNWRPTTIHEGLDYSYRLFTIDAFNAWIAKAEETIRAWTLAGDGENGGTIGMIEELIACSQGEVYDEGFESEDPQVTEAASMRFHKRHDLLSDLKRCRNASGMLGETSLRISGDDGTFVRAADQRYFELNCWGDTGEPSIEFKGLRVTLDLF